MIQSASAMYSGQAIPSDPTVRMGKLANGLRYYIKKNSTPENRAELRLAVNAGAMQEDDDQLGLAHFVEHMAFNGTKNFEKSELVDYLESVGTKFGPDLNAYTSFDETVYMLQVRTDEEDNLQKGLLVLEDWAGTITFDHEEIDKERGVVISEWRSRLSPDQRMQQVHFPVMYHNSRYAKRLPIGKPEIIKNADYEVFKRFYRDWYRPDLMAVAIVGDIDVDEMEQQIQTRFGNLTNPENPRPRTKSEVPDHDETLISIVSDPESSFTTARLMYKHDFEPVEDLQDFYQQLVHYLYNSMLNARLDELAQSPEPPFTFAYSGYSRDVGDLATYEGYAFTAEGKVMKGLETLLTENERVKQHGFLASEMERQKKEMLKQAERALKEQDKTKSRRLVMKYVYHFLDDNPIPGPEQVFNFYQEMLPKITLEEVNALAQKWITDENRVIVVTGPEKVEVPLPSEGEVRALMDQVVNTPINPYVDNVSSEPLLAETLSPVSIKENKQVKTVGVEEITLENGVTVVLKQTDFKNDEVLFSAYSFGGNSLYPDAEYSTVTNAASIIGESGLGNFSLPQLQKYLAGKTVGVSPFIGELIEGFNGSASPDDLETALQMVYLYFTAPRKDEQVLQSYIAKEKSIYDNLMSNPQYWFYDQTSQIKFNNHPRRGFPKTAELEKIQMDRVYEVFRERFSDASDFTFVFVGNFDPAELKKLAATYLGNLPATMKPEMYKDVNADYVEGEVIRDLKRGKAPKALVELTWHGKAKWDKKSAYHFKSMIDVLRIKMRESMREDKGGVYGVRVRGNVGKRPKEMYSITVSFNSEPDMAEELVQTAIKDIETAKASGATEKDLNKVKETQRQSRVKDLKENRYWLNRISQNYRDDEGKSLDGLTLENLESYIKELSSDDIKAAANQFFGENYIKIVMQPESLEN